MSDTPVNQPQDTPQPQPQPQGVPSPALPTPAKPAETWMVAAWPGMGNVAVLAAGYLVNTLGLQPIGEMVVRSVGIGSGHKQASGQPLNVSDVFDVNHVQVKDGVVIPPRLPRNLLFRSATPINGRNLVVFIGEAQPSSGNYAFAHALLDKAQELGVTKVLTFASMASQIEPTQSPRIFGVATKPGALEQVKRLEVQALEDGQISGLNGVLLGAASERGMTGVGLLGEIPFFAPQVVNPRAARGVLDAFGLMSGIDLDFKPIEQHIEKVDRLLLRLQERLQSSGENGEHAGEPINLQELVSELQEEDAELGHDGGMDAITPNEARQEAPVGIEARERIEGMFEAARQDRSKCVALKVELDRLGVFKQYENRFLDLFRRAE